MTDTQLIDQEGIGFLSSELAKIGCTFNDYHREVGIDGIIEIREAAYISSGKFIGLQQKSGESFFKNENAEAYFVYMDMNHIDYWLRCILPILFCIYSPEQKKAYYTVINKKNLFSVGKMVKIEIKKDSKIPGLDKRKLLEIFYGRIIDDQDCENIFKEMKNTQVCINKRGAKISILEIYISGITDLCDAIYFNTDLVSIICESKTPNGEMFSFPQYDFLDNYFKILNYYNLIEGDFTSETKKINEEMFPIFLKSFSISGNIFNSFLRNKGINIHDRLFVCSTNNDLFLNE